MLGNVDRRFLNNLKGRRFRPHDHLLRFQQTQINSNFSASPMATQKDSKDVEPPPIQISITRNLSDKLYEKRKLGALEVEQLVKELATSKDEDRIKSVIQHLVTNFSDSSQGNSRKGGLIALAATAIGLGAISFYNPSLFLPTRTTTTITYCSPPS